jgi:uncharacterized damage-inducible protein DinB
MTPEPPVRPDDVPATPVAKWDERELLTTMLDYTRGTVHAKCAGLSDTGARRQLLPGSPLMTISGVISHLRWVEYGWFEVTFLGREDEGPWTEEDREMTIATSIPLRQLLDEYEAACASYRELVAGHDLDALSRGPLDWRNEPVSLRWILHHLIEETARHNGHLDLMRELTDGVTGR